MKDGSEVLIPKAARKNLINVLHLTHLAVDSMLLQCKSRIFWPGMKKDLEACYRDCTLHKNSKPKKNLSMISPNPKLVKSIIKKKNSASVTIKPFLLNSHFLRLNY